MAPLGQTFWGNIWKRTVEKSQTIIVYYDLSSTIWFDKMESFWIFWSIWKFTGASEILLERLWFYWSVWEPAWVLEILMEHLRFFGASVESLVPKKCLLEKTLPSVCTYRIGVVSKKFVSSWYRSNIWSRHTVASVARSYLLYCIVFLNRSCTAGLPEDNQKLHEEESLQMRF